MPETPPQASRHPGRNSARSHPLRPSLSLALCLALATLLSGCERASKAAPHGAMPPPEVGVVVVEPAPVGLQTELPGRIEPYRVAQIGARVAGILQKRLFEEGSEVQAGQALYQIDPAPFQLAQEGAEASVLKAEAALAQAQDVLQRNGPLAEDGAVSQQTLVAARLAVQQASADLASARASAQTARLNLGYARVSSPIAGRVGQTLVTEGALVGQGQVTPLTTVQQLDPVYINFTQSADEVLRLRRSLAHGQLKRVQGTQAASVRVMLPDGSEYPRPGKLFFSGVTVDVSTGQVTLRAEVPNPERVLMPGLYARVRLEQAQASEGLLLPQQAVTRTQTGDTVKVVGPDGQVSVRSVQIATAVSGQWVVLGGLNAGEQVMVDGFQKLRGNAPVKPVPWKSPPEATPTPGTPGNTGAKP